MTDATTLDRSHFTTSRREHRDHGVTVTFRVEPLELDHDDIAVIHCTLCAAPTVIGLAVEQDCAVHDSIAGAYGGTDDYLCADCTETNAPGLLRAARDQHAAEDAIRAYRDKTYLADWDNALDRVQAAAPGVLRRLGFDEFTITEAVAHRPDSIVLSTRMTGSRIIGAHVPGGEIHFMADDADPDGH